MAAFGDGLSSMGGLDGMGGIGGGGSTGGPHLTYSAQLFSESMRRGEIQTWEGEESEIVERFNGMNVGDAADDCRFISGADDSWGTPFIGGVQAPRRAGKTWTMQVTVVQLRKCVLWTLDFAEIQKDIRTWRQDVVPDGREPENGNDEIPDLLKLAQWERAKDDREDYNYAHYMTVDGVALSGGTLELAKMIRRGIESYTIHTPVPTMTMRYFDEVKGTGVLLDKYLDSLPTGPSGWAELGGADIQSQLNGLHTVSTDGAGGYGTKEYKWLCIADKSTPNGDGSCTRVVQFMRVDSVEDKLYSRGDAGEGGLK